MALYSGFRYCKRPALRLDFRGPRPLRSRLVQPGTRKATLAHHAPTLGQVRALVAAVRRPQRSSSLSSAPARRAPRKRRLRRRGKAVVNMVLNGKKLGVRSPGNGLRRRELEVLNETNPKQVGPHTFSLVEKSALPKTANGAQKAASRRSTSASRSPIGTGSTRKPKRSRSTRSRPAPRAGARSATTAARRATRGSPVKPSPGRTSPSR